MKKILFSALLALTFAACQKNDIDISTIPVVGEKMTLTAVIGGSTRLSMDDTTTANTIKLAWSENDEIVVHYTDGTTDHEDTFTWVEGNTFEGILSATPAEGKFTNVTYNADADFTKQDGSLSDDFVWMETGEAAVGSTLSFEHKSAILKPDFESFSIQSIPQNADVTITGVHTNSGSLTFTAGNEFKYIYLPMGDKKFEKYSTLSFTVKVGENKYSGSTTPSSKVIEAGKLYTPPVNKSCYITYTADKKISVTSSNTLSIKYGGFRHDYENPNGCLEIYSTLPEIPANTFSGNTAIISSMTLPHCVTSISNSAFSDCTNLTNINLSRNLTNISGGAFYKCKSLTSIDFPNGLTTIGNSAFEYCEKLKSVNFPNSLTTIGEYAFRFCTELENIDLPEGLETIKRYAFNSCRKEKDIVIPSTVTYIGSYAFSSNTVGDNSAVTVTVKAINPPTLESNNVFNDRNITAIYVPAESVNNYKTADKWSSYADKIKAIPVPM